MLSYEGKRLLKTGMRRRSKEVLRMRLMTCLAVFFLVVTMLLQDNVNAFQMQFNFNRFGKWVVCASPEAELQAKALFKEPTEVVCGAQILDPRVSGVESDVVLSVIENDDGTQEYEFAPLTDENGDPLPPEDEIDVLLERCDRFTNETAGFMPFDFAERNRIELYEGRMPESADEIAVELSVLQKLGYDYTLGKQIQFYVPLPYDLENGIGPTIRLRLYSFTLVGTIKRYSFSWTGNGMPNALLTEEGLASIETDKVSVQYYEYKDEIDTPDMWNSTESVFDRIGEPDPGNPDLIRISSDGDRVWVNSEAYLSPIWGSPALYRAVTVFFILVCAAIITYLMAAYLNGRRMFYIKMRELGSSSKEVLGAAAYECVVSVLPYAAVSFVLAYGVSALICLAVSRISRVPYTFVFSIKTLLITLCAVALMLGLSLAASLALFAGRGIHEKKKPLSDRVSLRLRNRAERSSRKAYLGLGETLYRDRISHSARTWALRIVSLLVCGITVFASTRMTRAVFYYFKAKSLPSVTAYFLNNDHCYSACTADTEPHAGDHGRRVSKEKINYDYGGFLSFDNVIEGSQLEELNSIQGISKVEANTFDCKHYLTWEGCEGDAFINYCAEKALPGYGSMYTVTLVYDGPHYQDMITAASRAFYRIFCYSDPSELWNAAKKYLDPGVMDREAFMRGEQVIILYDESGESVVYHDEDEAPVPSADLTESYPLSLKAGDVVYTERVNTAKQKLTVPTTVAGIVPMGKTGMDVPIIDEILVGEQKTVLFTVIGSSEYARRIMESEGLEYGANSLNVYLNSVGKRDKVSGDIITVFSQEPDLQFNDNEEILELEQRTMLEELLTYGAFTLTLALLWVFVMRTAASEEKSRHADMMRETALFGADIKGLKMQLGTDTLKQSAWMLVVIPIYTALTFGLYFINRLKLWTNENYKMTSAEAVKLFFGNLTTADGRELLMNEGSCAVQVTLIVTLLFMVALFLINRSVDLKAAQTYGHERSK